ncbi:GNAT family N-acetyltransferase [Paenibacillus whitsoniae]|uniref:GNAT family N-acetyltransferase n=2 Tax=Paenibacillus whitsoniae TaxID=2496558 RepID=A0A430J9E6_9BACL|nr:GNAT family N-acetyltransferase [Paenibacillus whitsoniae]
MPMSITFETTHEWQESRWNQAETVYNEAFPEAGRKSRAIVKRMFERGIAILHTWHENGDVVAMALSSVNKQAKVLVIDYIAVRQDHRGRGLGRRCIADIQAWASIEAGCKAIVIEVEAEETPVNRERIQFWQRVGFHLTAYVHPYIWVPETYRAMYLNLDEDELLTDDGKKLFTYITNYHERAYRGKL